MLLSFAIFLALDIIAVPMPLACTRGEVIIFQKLTSYYLSHLGVQLSARSQTRSRWKVRLTLSFILFYLFALSLLLPWLTKSAE